METRHGSQVLPLKFGRSAVGRGELEYHRQILGMQAHAVRARSNECMQIYFLHNHHPMAVKTYHQRWIFFDGYDH